VDVDPPTEAPQVVLELQATVVVHVGDVQDVQVGRLLIPKWRADIEQPDGPVVRAGDKRVQVDNERVVHLPEVVVAIASRGDPTIWQDLNCLDSCIVPP
jgi:hypothetical protein